MEGVTLPQMPLVGVRRGMLSSSSIGRHALREVRAVQGTSNTSPVRTSPRPPVVVDPTAMVVVLEQEEGVV